jgi:predicted RNA methylase
LSTNRTSAAHGNVRKPTTTSIYHHHHDDGDDEKTAGGVSMARLAAKARCNYYPLPDREAELIRSCLSFPDQPFSALDPCAGEGRAMAITTGSSQAVTYGIELDSYRAEAAAKVLDEVVQGDALSAHARVESFGLIYANPPFDAEFGESGNQRLEVLFLSHFARWLVPGGVLVYVLPAQQLAGCANVLASHFRDIHVLRLASPECVLYEQVVVFAIARSRRERDRARDSEISFSRNHLVSTSRQYEMLPILSERRVELRVPPTGPAEVTYTGLPFDAIEDMLPTSPAYRQVAQILDPQPISLNTRPLTPLHKGHIGLLSTAGLLNGRFGSGDRLHVAAWKTKKRVIRTEDTEDEKTIIREREQFVHELALAFANGETALIE